MQRLQPPQTAMGREDWVPMGKDGAASACDCGHGLRCVVAPRVPGRRAGSRRGLTVEESGCRETTRLRGNPLDGDTQSNRSSRSRLSQKTAVTGHQPAAWATKTGKEMATQHRMGRLPRPRRCAPTSAGGTDRRFHSEERFPSAPELKLKAAAKPSIIYSGK